MASQHTAEFRQEAVRVALTSGLNRKQVAPVFQNGRYQRSIAPLERPQDLWTSPCVSHRHQRQHRQYQPQSRLHAGSWHQPLVPAPKTRWVFMGAER